jgi:hypothetical protein
VKIGLCPEFGVNFVLLRKESFINFSLNTYSDVFLKIGSIGKSIAC